MTSRQTKMSTLFRKNLLDLVKGIRSNKASESDYINQCLSEIKEEVKFNDKNVKANAISKLTYLYMMGYDISFAHFNIVEVMSQPSFSHKRIAYLAGSLSFTQETDVVLLTIHSFKKVFKNTSCSNAALAEGQKYEIGCAINCLANICTPYLAESLLEDIYALMMSSTPYTRKKAVLVLYAIFRKFPRALPLSFERLKNKLADDDPGVQNAAVNVVCELARKNPSNYLALLPQLFDLLNNSNNNWMLIKLVKLLGSLIPAEPRLCKKLQEPLTHIITNTPAKSLLYECISTVTSAPSVPKSMIRLCLEKLRTFVEDPDQNLKYLGLLGLNKVMHKNMKAVSQHKDLILQCLDDPDPTIRMRALDLITSMVNERNLEAIIQRLTDHLYGTDGNYRDHVLEQIINVCKKQDYEYVRDFAWYVQLLTNMTGLSSMCKRNAEIVSSQLMDVTIRVPAVREFSVQQMEGIIVNNGLISDSHNMQSNAICRVLEASAYIVGEYAIYVKAQLSLVKAMLQSRIASLPGDIQCIFIHNALKVVCSGLQNFILSKKKMKQLKGVENSDSEDEDEDEDDNDETNTGNGQLKFEQCLELIDGTVTLLKPLALSSYVEVQERANSYLFFMEWLKREFEACDTERRDFALAFGQAFASELMPVHPESQEMVAKKIPKGLDLDAWIGEEWLNSDDSDSEEDSDSWDLGVGHSNTKKGDGNAHDHADDDWFYGSSVKKKKKLTKAERQVMAEKSAARINMQHESPFYINAENDDNKMNDIDSEEEWRGKHKSRRKEKSDEAETETKKKKKKKHKKKKKKGKRKHRSGYDIPDSDSGSDDDDEHNTKPEHETIIDSANPGIKVFPTNYKKSKSRRAKKYVVLNKNQELNSKKTSKSSKSKKNKKSKKNINSSSKNGTAAQIVDPLAMDLDLTQPCNDVMPGIKPYQRPNEFTLPSEMPSDAKQNKTEEQKQNEETKENEPKSTKNKKLTKKQKRKLKKEAKRQKKAEKRAAKKARARNLENDNDTQENTNPKKKAKKSKNKTKIEIEKPAEPVEINLLGDLGFGDMNGNADLIPKPNSNSNHNSNMDQTSFDPLDILSFDNSNSNSNSKQAQPRTATTTTTSTSISSSSRSTATAKKKNGFKSKITGNDYPNLTKRNLFSDSSLVIDYTCRAKNKKKNVLLIQFVLENNSEQTAKNINISFSKSKLFTFKPKSKKSKKSKSDDDSNKFELAKKLKCNSSVEVSFEIKCNEYYGGDNIKCKLNYVIDKQKQKQICNIVLPTHAFIVVNPNNLNLSQDSFLEIAETCTSKCSVAFKLKQLELEQVLDIICSTWQLQAINSKSKKHFSYYAALLLDRHLTIYVKLSKNEKSVQISIKTTQQTFADSMAEEVETILQSAA